MPVGEVKWWQWFLLSLLCGSALALLHLQPFKATEVTSMGMVRLERLVDEGKITIRGQDFAPFINVTVYPIMKTQAGTELCQVELYVLDAAKGEYDPRICNTDVPYYPQKPTTPVAAEPNETADAMAARYYGVKSVPREVMYAIYDANRMLQSNPHMVLRAGQMYNMPPKWTHTVWEYLAEQAKSPNKDWIHETYAWWTLPAAVWSMWLGGSVLIVGIIWPIVLRLLVKGGFGPPPSEKLMDISRYGKGRKEQATMPVAAMTISAEEMARIDALEEKVMADLKEQAATAPPPPPKPEPAEIKSLSTTQEAAAVVTEEHHLKTSKDFRGGQFYPVATPDAQPKPPTKAEIKAAKAAAKKKDRQKKP